MSSPNTNLALLIDGDNVSAKVIVGLMAEIANYGTASVRRIYGDWTSPYLSSWKPCLLQHSILPIQQFAYTTGKNATDGAMIIDAMDLMYTGRFSAFCIVSSDSDFTRLAARIREQGITVYGFGERKTNSAFIAACDKFMYFDALIAPEEEEEEEVPWGGDKYISDAVPGHQIPHVRLPKQNDVGVHNVVGGESTSHEPPKRPLDRAALAALVKAVANAETVHDDQWVHLAKVGNILVKMAPDLQARNYGYRRLKDFVEASGVVDMRVETVGNYPAVYFVRLKKDLT
jgi:uncharacterized LabA/DUF88 family protein